uniref:Protein kinase domain-containing protein n=1 Tax=Heterosigma akashiwo TaxID=2829 RepID=A0A7S3Y7Z5_HETAK
MAPELLANKAFNKKVDVYAFAVLLWEIMEEAIPFSQCEPQEIMKVVGAGERPPLGNWYSPELRQLIQQCWADDPAERPDFDEILDTLTIIDSAMPARSNCDQLGDDFGGDALDSLLGK